MNTKIPARIISISDKVIVEWPYIPKPEPLENESMQSDAYIGRLIKWLELPLSTIAEVENVHLCKEDGTAISKGQCWRLNNMSKTGESLSLNQFCFIEPISEGKCRIIKI